jgi:NitT/TauT family transport system substrate-binding protein
MKSPRLFRLSHLDAFRVGLALGCALLGNNGGSLFSQTPAASTPLADTPLTVQLDWKPSAQFAGILVAIQNGYYRREHLHITVRAADTAMAPFAQIANSSNIIGVSEAEPLIAERAKGIQIRAFATMMQATPFSLFTLKQSGLTTFASLHGKRIGLYGDGRRAIEELLRFNRMTEKDVTLVEIPFSLDPLLKGQIDAMQGYTVDEAVRLNMAHHAINILPMAENGYVSYAEVLLTSPTLIAGHPDELVRFLRATRDGWAWAAAHQNETARMIIAKYMPGRSLEEQRLSLAQTIPLINAETHAGRYGEMRRETWDRCLAVFLRDKHLKPPLTQNDLVDYSILNKLDPPAL